MTEKTQSIRAFFAIELPEDIKKYLHHATLSLHPPSHTIRWVDQNNLHITLHFIAEVAADDLVPLIQTVKTQLLTIRPFTLQLGALYLFPNAHSPHIIATEVQPSSELVDCHTHIGKGLIAHHYSIEQRRFHPHITLGRIQRRSNMDLNLEEIPFNLRTILVKEIIFYQSQAGPQGSLYTPLTRIPLSQ